MPRKATKSAEAIWMKRRRKSWKQARRCIDCGLLNDRTAQRRKTCSGCAKRKADEYALRKKRKNPKGQWWAS